MLSSLSRSEMVAGGVAAASVGLLAYTLTRPTKPKKVRRGGPRKPTFTKRFTKKPLDIHLAMSTEEGFHALIAADKKNKALGLKYGAYLVKINDIKVREWTHEAIIDKLTKVKVPCTLTFREEKELEAQFNEAEALKEKANELYKQKKLTEAVDWLSQAIAKHPTNKVFYSNRVLMLLSLSKYEEALEDCRMIRVLDPTARYVKGHYLRGMVFMKKQEHKHAAAAFQTVLKIQPTFKQATDRLTDCMKRIDSLRDEARRKRRESAAALKEKARLKREAAEAERLKKEAIEQAAQQKAADEAAAEQSDKADLAATLLQSAGVSAAAAAADEPEPQPQTEAADDITEDIPTESASSTSAAAIPTAKEAAAAPIAAVESSAADIASVAADYDSGVANASAMDSEEPMVEAMVAADSAAEAEADADASPAQAENEDAKVESEVAMMEDDDAEDKDVAAVVAVAGADADADEPTETVTVPEKVISASLEEDLADEPTAEEAEMSAQ